MPKAKRNRTGILSRLINNKSVHSDRSHLNLLEQLFIFHSLPDVWVKPESGCHFRISRQENEKGVLLLFKIDDNKLHGQNEIRPDYMTLYMCAAGCFCTIIEMKGRGESDLNHAVDQIQSFARRLDASIRSILPGRLQIKIQGLILSRPNVNLPKPKLEKLARQGLQICHFACPSRAELFPYISTSISWNMRCNNESRRNSTTNCLERILRGNGLHVRMPSELSHNSSERVVPEGMVVNLLLSESDEYATLYATPSGVFLFVKEQGTVHLDELAACIQNVGLGDKITVSKVDP